MPADSTTDSGSLYQTKRGILTLQTPNDVPIHVHRQSLRVNYSETDGQRRVHHANYLNYFERGRVEMLRSVGISYKQLEQDGLLLVVTEMNVRYLAAAEFDDVLELTTELMEVRKVRVRHRYRLHRGEELIVEADSVIACLGEGGLAGRFPADRRCPQRR